MQVRHQPLPLFAALLFAVVSLAPARGTAHGPSTALTPSTAAEYLQPEPGPYTPVYGGGLYSRYHDELFDGETGARTAQLVVVSDKRGPEAVFLAADTTGSCKGREVAHVALTFPTESEEGNQAAKKANRNVKRATLDCATGATIEKLWEQMLCDVRYDEREKTEIRVNIHADVYHFSYGSKSGVTREPDRNSLVGELGRFGLQLAAFADAPKNVQAQLSANLSLNAARLLSFARARNSRVGAAPFCAP